MHQSNWPGERMDGRRVNVEKPMLLKNRQKFSSLMSSWAATSRTLEPGDGGCGARVRPVAAGTATRPTHVSARSRTKTSAPQAMLNVFEISQFSCLHPASTFVLRSTYLPLPPSYLYLGTPACIVRSNTNTPDPRPRTVHGTSTVNSTVSIESRRDLSEIYRRVARYGTSCDCVSAEPTVSPERIAHVYCTSCEA